MTLHYRRLTGSTNAEARLLAIAGAPCGTAVLARAQSGGQGRQGRAWSSPAGNLYLSVVLRPQAPPARVPELSFVVAVAVAEALAPWLPAVRLKWPNDVLADGAKLGGILLESQFVGRSLDWVVAGIGVNLVSAPEGTPYPVTSLSQQGAVARPGAVARAALAALGRGVATWQQAGFAPVRRAWCARGHRPGDALTVREGGQPVPGRFAGLAEDGALLLETAGGLRRIAAGDVGL